MLLPAGKSVLVNLRLDVQFLDAGRFVQPVHLDFVVEMADVADDGLVFHLLHVIQRDDFAVARAGDVDVGHAQRLFNGGDFETFHRRLQGVDGIDFRHDDARAEAAQRMRRAFADVAVTADHRHFARDHHVGGALDAVGQRLAAAVKIVKLGFGDGVIDVDGRHQKFSGFLHLIEAMDAGGRFFADAFPIFDHGRARSAGAPSPRA